MPIAIFFVFVIWDLALFDVARCSETQITFLRVVCDRPIAIFFVFVIWDLALFDVAKCSETQITILTVVCSRLSVSGDDRIAAQVEDERGLVEKEGSRPRSSLVLLLWVMHY